MKTVVFIPDKTYFDVEKMARNLGIPKNALHFYALRDYLKKNKRENITQKLNEVYDDDYYKGFEPISNASLESMRELTTNLRF